MMRYALKNLIETPLGACLLAVTLGGCEITVEGLEDININVIEKTGEESVELVLFKEERWQRHPLWQDESGKWQTRIDLLLEAGNYPWYVQTSDGRNCATVNPVLSPGGTALGKCGAEVIEREMRSLTEGYYHFAVQDTEEAQTQFEFYLVEEINPQEADIYVRGGMTEDWGTYEDMQFVKTEQDTYIARFHIEAGEYRWMIADETWSEVLCGAAPQEIEDFPPPVEVSLALLKDGWHGDCQTRSPSQFLTHFPESGEYEFKLIFGAGFGLEPDIFVTPVGEFEAFDFDIFVRGSMQDDWGAVTENKLYYEGDSRYSTDIYMTGGVTQWRVADEDWMRLSCGAGVQEIEDFPPPLAVSLDELSQGWVGNCDSWSPPNFETQFNDGLYYFTVDFSNDADNPLFYVNEINLCAMGAVDYFDEEPVGCDPY